jgi:hypothetical protein
MKGPLVAPARAQAILNFGEDLARLCKRYGVEIYGSPDGSFVEVVDMKRKSPMPDGYEFEATFEGCDPAGVFRIDDKGEKTYQAIGIEDWMQEDEAEGASALPAKSGMTGADSQEGNYGGESKRGGGTDSGMGGYLMKLPALQAAQQQATVDPKAERGGPLPGDAEVICGWMEPKPKDGHGPKVETVDVRWWQYSYEVRPKPSGLGNEFHWQWWSRTLTLNELWEVEERLAEWQFWQYANLLLPSCTSVGSAAGVYAHAHATAEQKIKALAQVIREGWCGFKGESG